MLWLVEMASEAHLVADLGGLFLDLRIGGVGQTIARNEGRSTPVLAYGLAPQLAQTQVVPGLGPTGLPPPHWFRSSTL